MGCFGDREKGPPEHTAKWAYLTLSDFKCTSAWTGFAYAWLWFMAFVAVAVFGVDTFTAVNLLLFNRWSSQIEPPVPFTYTRWIFAGCIMLSWVLYAYEWQRAVRVIRRGGVAESYMDSLAVSLQSMRGNGWKRFLVFTELTKSRKGADYAALFVYFAFQGAVRVILAEGPRQAINGMTLYAVLRADLLTVGDHPAIVQFFLNVQALAEQNNTHAAIYFSMLFTLVIWVFSALSLVIAGLIYLLFLWHYIPQCDGRLSVYCRRKIDKRLERIVEHKVKAALEEEERLKRKAEKKELKRQKTDLSGQPPAVPKLARQPTLPQLDAASDTSDTDADDKLSGSHLSRQNTNTTVSTLPVYTNRPQTRNGPTPGPMNHYEPMSDDHPGMPRRMGTQSSGWSDGRPRMPRSATNASASTNTSFGDQAPLLANAGFAGADNNLPTMPPTAWNRQGTASPMNQGRPGGRPGPGPDDFAARRPFAPLSRADTIGSSRSYDPYSSSSNGPNAPGAGVDQQYGDDPILALNRPHMVPNDRSYSPAPRSGTPGSSRPYILGQMNGPPQTRPPPPSQHLPPPQSAMGLDFGLDRPSTGFSNAQLPEQGNLPSRVTSPAQFGPPSRQATPGNQQTYMRPPVREQTYTSFRPSSARPNGRTSPDSYEMSANPSHQQLNQTPSATSYVPFNPGLRNTNSTPIPNPSDAQAVPKVGPASVLPHAVTVVGGPGTNNNYFGHVRDTSLRGAAAQTPLAHNAESYDDILDDYGPSTSTETGPGTARRL